MSSALPTPTSAWTVAWSRFSTVVGTSGVSTTSACMESVTPHELLSVGVSTGEDGVGTGDSIGPARQGLALSVTLSANRVRERRVPAAELAGQRRGSTWLSTLKRPQPERIGR